MKYGRYGWSHLFMSWGLGIVFLWIGLDMLRHPESWIGFLPQNIPLGLARETALQINGVLDVALGSLLILRWWQKLVAVIAAAHLIGIVVYNGIDAVLIRDIGLLGAALALAVWPTKYRKRRMFKLFNRSSKSSSEDSAE
ncbi:MAG: hypothetical protein WEC84_02565 [Candidatus Andersenbacteria bacterium]